MRVVHWLSISALCFSVTLGCSSPPPEAPPKVEVEGPEYTPTATIKEIMVSMVDPAGDLVWDSVTSVVDKNGLKETIPRTDEDWAKVRQGAITLMESANLLMMPGRQMARPGEKSEVPGVELEPSEMLALIDKGRGLWNAHAKALHDRATDVLAAVDAKDHQKIFELGDALDTACESCHRQYWYPNEKIPDFPSAVTNPGAK